FLIEELGLDYWTFTLIITAAVITSFVGQRYWGDFADKYGNMRMVRLAALLIVPVPFAWLLSVNVAYLFGVQLVAGFIWAGFNLSSINFIYDVAVSNKRERCISYFNALSGFGLGAGALLGGYLYRYLPPVHGSKFYTLLIISGGLRLLFGLALLLFTREVRNVQPIRTRTLLYDMSGIRSIGLLSRELLFRPTKDQGAK
ncbi:MAG: MFS transporter, partial [bacterium]